MKFRYVLSVLLSSYCLCDAVTLTITNNTDNQLRLDLVSTVSLDSSPLYDDDELSVEPLQSKTLNPNQTTTVSFQDIVNTSLKVSTNGIKKGYSIDFFYGDDPRKRTRWTFTPVTKNGTQDIDLVRS